MTGILEFSWRSFSLCDTCAFSQHAACLHLLCHRVLYRSKQLSVCCRINLVYYVRSLTFSSKTKSSLENSTDQDLQSLVTDHLGRKQLVNLLQFIMFIWWLIFIYYSSLHLALKSAGYAVVSAVFTEDCICNVDSVRLFARNESKQIKLSKMPDLLI